MQGWRKYPDSKLLISSAERDWSAISAELRSHSACDTSAVPQQLLEVWLTIEGAPQGLVTRTVGGVRQLAVPVDGTIWLSPVDLGDSVARFSTPIPQVLHLFLPVTPFTRLAEQYNLPRSPGRLIRHVSGARDDLIWQIGMVILAEMRAETAAGRMLIETSAIMLAARLSHSYADDWAALPSPARHRLNSTRLRLVLDYIEANLGNDISIAALAALSYLSVFHFSRMFSAAVGLSPYRYVSERRLEKAKQLLAAGNTSLSEIAQWARFSNQASFTRAFTRAVGVSPGAYRRKIR